MNRLYISILPCLPSAEIPDNLQNLKQGNKKQTIRAPFFNSRYLNSAFALAVVLLLIFSFIPDQNHALAIVLNLSV